MTYSKIVIPNGIDTFHISMTSDELIIQGGCFMQLILHITYSLPWIDDLDTWAVTHEHRVHFNIDHDLNLKDTAAFLFIHLQKYLRRMDRLRAYISALLARRPEPYLPRGIPYILAHSDYIVKEVLGIEIRILPERDVGRFNTYYSVKSEIEQDKIGRTTAEKEPAVTEFLQKIWVQYVFLGLSRRKRLIRYRSVCL